MEVMSKESEKLREGWTETTLGEACVLIMGQSPPSTAYNGAGNGLPFFQGKSEFGDLHPVAVKWCTEPNKIAEQGDVLLSVRAPVGPTNLADQQCCIGRGLSAVRPQNGTLSKYVLYYLRSIESSIDALGTGTTFKAVSGKVLRDLPFPLAPLPDQRRIVEAIERQLGRLEAGVARLQAAKARLKRYKQAVLKAAVDEALANPKAESVVLADVADLCLGKMLDRQKNVGTPHPYLRNINVRWGTFDTEDLHQMPFGDHEHDRFGLVKGDLVMCEGGEPGRCAVWDGSILDMKIQKALHRIRCSDQADPHFVMYNFLSACWLGTIDKYYTGTTIKHLTGKMLARFELVLPPIKEQRRLVARIQEAFDRTEVMDSTLDAQLLQAGRLRQAVLKRAFEGRLV